MVKIVSIIPIKMNNERLPGKNTKPLGGKPLMYYVQENLLAMNKIDERYVFCSNEDVQNYLLPGINYLNRPNYLDRQNANFTQIFSEFMNLVLADIYVYAHATAPFIRESTTRECIDKVLFGEYDSAFCAVKIQDFLWSNNEPLNFKAENLPRSQDLPIIYRETSGVYVFHRSVFEKYHRRIGKKPFIKEVTYREAVDINTPEDFELAQLMLKSN